MNESAHWIGVASLAASLAVNSVIFFTVDHAVSQGKPAHTFFIPKESSTKQIVQFEFVEAPPIPSKESPKKTRKIAARDSMASDATEGLKKDAAPKVAASRSDQLAQRPSQGTPPRPQASVKKTIAPEDPRNLLPSFKKPVKPGAEVWMPGQGKILSQEMAKAKSKGAKFYGVTSFEATGSGMGVYMERLKERIWEQWFPYIAFKFPRDFRGADAVIHFKIDAQGKVKSARVVESKGTPLFAAFCVEAVRRAGNFGELPKEILALTGKDNLEINFGFHYG